MNTQWVATKDRLPEEQAEYLAVIAGCWRAETWRYVTVLDWWPFTHTPGMAGTWAYVSSGGDVERITAPNDYQIVTHWALLPDLPEEGEP